MDKHYNFEEAGAILGGVSPHTLRLWVRRGLIGHVRLGRRIVLSPEDLQRFVEARRVVAKNRGRRNA